MRLPNSAGTRSQLRFNITPLIDIVFLLIIFFLVASHFVRNEVAEEVDLPLAEFTSAEEEAAAGRMTITVNRTGGLSVFGTPIDFEEAAFRIGELRNSGDESVEVRVRADRLSEYGAVRQILRICADNQIQSIQFAVVDAAIAQN